MSRSKSWIFMARASVFGRRASRWFSLAASLSLHVAATAQAAPPPDRWEKTIEAFEASDKASPPPKNALLLVGGSNARRWTDVADYFPGEKILNRGFGGAQLAEVLRFADRIVIPYAPRIVFLNAGGNDLAAGKSPEQVRDACKAFVAIVGAALP
jgi:lysophospholipase L1-like esterase